MQRQLVGGFSCDISIEELNQWTRYLMFENGDLMVRRDHTRGEISAMVANGSTPPRALHERLAQIDRSLFELAEGWYKSVEVARRLSAIEMQKRKEEDEAHWQKMTIGKFSPNFGGFPYQPQSPTGYVKMSSTGGPDEDDE